MTEDTEELITDLEKAQEAGADISAAIIRVADAFDALMSSGLTKRAIIVLIKDRTSGPGMAMRDIETVLDCIPDLRLFVKDEG